MCLEDAAGKAVVCMRQVFHVLMTIATVMHFTFGCCLHTHDLHAACMTDAEHAAHHSHHHTHHHTRHQGSNQLRQCSHADRHQHGANVSATADHCQRSATPAIAGLSVHSTSAVHSDAGDLQQPAAAGCLPHTHTCGPCRCSATPKHSADLQLSVWPAEVAPFEQTVTIQRSCAGLTVSLRPSASFAPVRPTGCLHLRL